MSFNKKKKKKILTIRILQNEHEQRTEINILAKFNAISWKILKTIIRFSLLEQSIRNIQSDFI